MTHLISCDAHDYFEIVCMRRSWVMVTTDKSEIIQGFALNISVIANEEVLELKDEDSLYYVRLTDVKKLQATGEVEQHRFIVEW